MQPFDLHAILEVTNIGYMVDSKLWRIDLKSFSGSMLDLTLYSNGGMSCPFSKGEFYQTDAEDHGGWNLTRVADNLTNLLLIRDPSEPLTTITDSQVARAKRHRAQSNETVCSSVIPPQQFPGYNFSTKAIPCQFVEGHSGQHKNYRGAGTGYEWSDDEFSDDTDVTDYCD